MTSLFRYPERVVNGRKVHSFFLLQGIVNRGEWLESSANIKGANKDAKIWVGKSTTVHNLLFCAHTLCMNYVTNTFLLVSSSVRSKQLLCFVHGQGQKREQKPTTKKVVGFHNHSPLLIMFRESLLCFIEVFPLIPLWMVWSAVVEILRFRSSTLCPVPRQCSKAANVFQDRMFFNRGTKRSGSLANFSCHGSHWM